jgi:D-alanyl-D-alanine carboxypeptidase
MTPEQIALAVAITAVVLAVGSFTPVGQSAVNAIRGKFKGGDAAQKASSTVQTLVSGPSVPNASKNDLHPTFRRKFDLYITAVRAAGWDVRVFETFRTPARQAWLFAQNRPDRWMTSKSGRPGDESLHQFGVATDIRIYVNGQPSFDTKKYAAMYKSIPPEKFGIEPLWGHEWVHLQIKGGYSTAYALKIKPNVVVGSRAFA